jgi:hypothetical protein
MPSMPPFRMMVMKPPVSHDFRWCGREKYASFGKDS